MLLAADEAYARLLLDDAGDREATMDQALALYREARERMLNFVLRFYTPQELLRPTVSPADLPAQPREVKEQILALLRAQRDRDPLLFPHTRVLTEFDGYFERIETRAAELEQAQAR